MNLDVQEILDRDSLQVIEFDEQLTTQEARMEQAMQDRGSPKHTSGFSKEAEGQPADVSQVGQGEDETRGY